jgi:TolB protein
VTVDGANPQHVGVDGAVTFSSLQPGTHSVEIQDYAGNCSVVGDNPRLVVVTENQTAATTFTVACAAIGGELEVSAETTGDALDPDGYTVSVDGGAGHALGINGTITIAATPGEHSVELSGVANNCLVDGENPRTVTATAGIAVPVAFAVSCTSATGSLVVTTTTTGDDLDPDGYTLTVNGGTGQAIAINTLVTLNDVAAGQRTAELTGVANNCTVTGDNPMTVTVPEDGTVQADFEIACVFITGSVEVITGTTGDDLDPDGYTVIIDGGVGQAIGINDAVTVSGVLRGQRSVQLLNIESNCVVSGDNPRTVTVPGEGTVQTIFTVVCSPLPGTLQVTANTTGSNLDPDGYLVSVDGGPAQAIGTNWTITINDVAAGDRSVALSDIAGNCSVVSGTNPRTVTVPANGTASTTFSVACVPQLSNQIVFDTDRDGNAEIYVMNPDGSGLQRLTNHPGRDAEPYVSFDGTKIAFASDRDGNDEIYVMNVDGTGLVRLTTSAGRDGEPAWSRDGTKIAFASERDGDSEIYVMNADGSGQVRLTSVAGRDGLPTWSPDGAQIAFTSERDGNLEIYVMNADGTGVAFNLTNNVAHDFVPEYSPTGDRILFTTERDGNREVYSMNASGTNPINLTNNAGVDMAADWSPNGLQIVFASGRDGNSEVYVMNADGSVQINLTNNGAWDFEASWNR